MKTLSSILTAVVLLCGSLNLTASNIEKGPNDIKDQVFEMIKNLNINQSEADEVSFLVDFMITPEGKIVVLSTSDEKYDNRIKATLNYKKVETDNFVSTKPYQVKVKLVK